MKIKDLFFLGFIIFLSATSCKRVDTKAEASLIDTTIMAESGKGKVTGIGGIFFKCDDPDKMKEWYSSQLGMVTDQYGSLFEFRQADASDEKAYLQWSPFPANTKYFNPSEKQFMINYRVVNIEALVEELKSKGVTILDSIETYDYGKFVHIMDPEGNKIELWEPVDSVFTASHEGKTTK